MKAVYCPYCGGRAKRNGRTSSWSRRWRRTARGASTTVRCDDTAAGLGEFLGRFLSKGSRATMPGGGRSFRRRTAEFRETWPTLAPDGGGGFAKAVRESWPQTMVRRCLWHAFSQENRHTTSRPRLRAGMLRGLDGVGAWFEGGRIWFCGAEKLGISFIREVTAFKRRITNKDSVILYHMEKTQQTHCTSCCVLRWFNSMRLEQT